MNLSVKSCLESSKLFVHLCGNAVTNKSVEFLDVLNVLKPGCLINGEKLLDGVKGNILKTFNVDVLSLGNVTDSGLNSVNLIFATSEDPVKNAEVVAEAGPDEVTFVIGTEPVNVEDLGSVGDNLAHLDPVLPVVAHVVANEGTHSHGVATNYADCTCSCSSGLGSHDGTNEGTVLPIEGLVNQGSGLCAASAEYDRGYGNTLEGVELGRNAGAVLCESGEAAVGMSTAGGLILLIELGAVPRSALPVDSVAGCGRIVVETFPPNGVVLGVVNNVGEDGVTHTGVKSVGVGLLVGTGSNAEEAVLGVDSIKLAVFLVNTEPSDIVAYAPNLVALLAVDRGRNEHCEVGLTASRGECSGDVLDVAVGILNAEDEHMLSHPAFLASEVGSNTESEALLTEKNVSSVTGVD